MRKTYLNFMLIFLLGVLGVPITAQAAKSFKIVSNSDTKVVGLPTSNAAIYAGPGNIVKGLTFQLSIQNTGDEDINVGDEGYTVSLHLRYDTNNILCTEAVSEPLAVGETKVVTVTWGGENGFSLEPLSANFQNGCVTMYNNNIVAFGVQADMTKLDQYQVLPTMTIYLDVAMLELLPEEEGAKPITGNSAFGILTADATEGVTKTFRLHASASRDVTINSVTLPEGYSTSVTFPVTIVGGVNATAPEDSYLTFPVTFNPATSGVYAGKMTFNVEGLDPVEYPVSGGKLGEGDFYADFEDEENPTPGWILGENIAVSNIDSRMATETNKKMLNHSRSGEDAVTKAITPKLSFGEGGKVLFSARANNSYGSKSPVVRVLYSADRVNWTSAGVVIYAQSTTTGNEDWTDLFDIATYPYAFRQYFANIPAGEYYIAFEMGNASIDDVMGGTLVDVDYDLFIENATAPESMMVNKGGIFSLQAKNILGNKGLRQPEYEVSLYVDGKKVATAEKVDWAPATSLKFDMGYVPHKAGEITVYMTLTAGELVLKSQEFKIPVSEEVLVGEATIGKPSLDNSNSTIPLDPYYNNSSSDYLMTESLLAAYGITPGTIIKGMKVMGYSQSVRSITNEMQVALKHTDMTTLSASDPEIDVTDDEIYFKATKWDLPGGRVTEPTIVLDCPFERQFVYQGGNLLLQTRSEKQSSYVRTYFQYSQEDRAGGFCRGRSNDNYNTYKSKSYTQPLYIPVITFELEVQPLTISGVVSHEGQPVAGAEVKLEGPEDVLYSSTTDENGAYSMTVFQAEKAYNMSVTAPGFVIYKAAEPVTFGKESVVKNVELNTYVTVTGNVANSRGEAVADATVSFISGDYSTSAVTDEEGNYTLKAYTYASAATLNVDSKDYVYAQRELDLTVPQDLSESFTLVSFTNDREFTLTVKAAAVIDVDLNGAPFTLKSGRFNETYPASETVLDADASCVIPVYGGAQQLTIKAVGLEEKVVAFNVNRDTTIEVLLGEDVQNPRDVRSVLIHDIITGKNDLKVTWNPDVATAKAIQRVPARSAANPYESFIITMDGQTVGTTEDYEYTIENVGGGYHVITVMAKYATTQSDVVNHAVEITNDNYVPVAFTLTNNANASAEGMTINLRGEEDYALSVNKDGRAMAGYLPRGTYNVAVDVYGYEPYAAEMDFEEPSFVDIALKEIIVKPYNLTVETTPNAEGDFEVAASWNHTFGMTDSFEDYADFSSEFGEWKTLNLDKTASYPMMLGNKLVTFPGSSTPDALESVPPMIFNPAGTTPSMEGVASVAAVTGAKSVIFMGPQAEAADKWLISPAVEIHEGFKWQFAAKAYTGYPETLELCISESGDEPADFKVVKKVNPGNEAWENYSVDLGQYAGKSIRVAVHCTSLDGFMVQVDDFKICDPDGVISADMGNVKEYEVTLGDASGNTKETAYTFSKVAAGKYTLGVKAVYASGASEQATYELNLVSGIGNIEGDAERGDVTTPAGVVILHDATPADLKKLDKGIYLYRGRKVVNK